MATLSITERPTANAVIDQAYETATLQSEKGDRVYALLVGITALLPRDENGDFEDLNLAKLVEMASDEVSKVGELRELRRLARAFKGLTEDGE